MIGFNFNYIPVISYRNNVKNLAGCVIPCFLSIYINNIAFVDNKIFAKINVN